MGEGCLERCQSLGDFPALLTHHSQVEPRLFIPVRKWGLGFRKFGDAQDLQRPREICPQPSTVNHTASALHQNEADLGSNMLSNRRRRKPSELDLPRAFPKGFGNGAVLWVRLDPDLYREVARAGRLPGSNRPAETKQVHVGVLVMGAVLWVFLDRRPALFNRLLDQIRPPRSTVLRARHAQPTDLARAARLARRHPWKRALCDQAKPGLRAGGPRWDPGRERQKPLREADDSHESNKPADARAPAHAEDPLRRSARDFPRRNRCGRHF